MPGWLNGPRASGASRQKTIGTDGKALDSENKLAYYHYQVLPIRLLSDPVLYLGTLHVPRR